MTEFSGIRIVSLEFPCDIVLQLHVVMATDRREQDNLTLRVIRGLL